MRHTCAVALGASTSQYFLGSYNLIDPRGNPSLSTYSITSSGAVGFFVGVDSAFVIPGARFSSWPDATKYGYAVICTGVGSSYIVV